MTGLLGFGLSKLKITAFSERGRAQSTEILSMKVMYNPESLNLNYGIEYDSDSYVNGSVRRNHFKQVNPGSLKLELLFDASLPGNNVSVESQLATLQLMCCEVNPDTMETPYLKVSWGKLQWGGKDHFSGRVASLEVSYNRFDRAGVPLRATVNLTLDADESEAFTAAELFKLRQPQVGLPVPNMSWLPMLAGAGAAMLGAFDYLALAVANDLDNLDAFDPGDILRTPAGDDEEGAQA